MSVAAIDGRVARGERTRRRVAEALIALLEAGTPEPTARQVAEQAGVSARIVFHHYDDMEQLLRAAVAVQVERHWSRMRPIDPSLALSERVTRLVRQRGALFDAIAPVRRAAALVEHRSPVVAAELARSRAGLRHELEHLFAPELAAPGTAGGDLLDALELAAGWDVWDQLRHHMGRPAPSARRVMTRMLSSLLDPSPADQSGATPTGRTGGRS